MLCVFCVYVYVCMRVYVCVYVHVLCVCCVCVGGGSTVCGLVCVLAQCPHLCEYLGQVEVGDGPEKRDKDFLNVFQDFIRE